MYSRKKSFEEIPKEMTPIWSCTAEECKGWMRDNFAFDHVPECHLCQSPMEKSVKELPILVNTNANYKNLKKGIQID
jgi:hypothetical protein